MVLRCRYRLRDKEENCAESECQCPSPALTPHQSKQPARGGVCLARKTERYIYHVSHLREDSPTYCQPQGKEYAAEVLLVPAFFLLWM